MCPVNFCLFSSTRGSMYSVPRDGINSPCSEGKFWSISDQWYMGGRTPALSPSRDHPPAFLRNPNSPDGPPFGGSIGGNGVIFLFKDLEIVIFFQIFSSWAHCAMRGSCQGGDAMLVNSWQCVYLCVWVCVSVCVSSCNGYEQLHRPLIRLLTNKTR